MVKKSYRDTENNHFYHRKRRRRKGFWNNDILMSQGPFGTTIMVGERLRALRNNRGFSLRSLAEISGLNFNTLSLIENGKSSPSVSTLQRLALALNVPITAFFESEGETIGVVYQKEGQRTKASFLHGSLANLGAGLNYQWGQVLLVSLNPGTNSGSTPIVHTGYEMVYCIEGHIDYNIDGEDYTLEPGDSLFFEAHLPHCWANKSEILSRSLLVFYPSDENDSPLEKHFPPEHLMNTR
ncbi:MAG: cupin domain-containing protein [Anaerolineales bacterium]|nr:cupin domain-containing protein [Anaerolineales bacterium]